MANPKRPKRKLPYKLVLVEWEDSARPVSAWQWADDYALPEIVRCISVGYMIAQSKEAIAIAPNIGDSESERVQVSGIIRIPTSSVRRVTELKN